jgi:hypothetical protein
MEVSYRHLLEAPFHTCSNGHFVTKIKRNALCDVSVSGLFSQDLARTIVHVNGIGITIIHHLIFRRLDFPFFNAVCLGWLQYLPSKEVLSVKFLHECLTPAVSYGKVVKLHPLRENKL